MKVQGQHRIAAPRERVWEGLLDPEVLANTLPGAKELRQTGDNHFEGALDIKVGPVQGRFDGDVTLADLDPGQGYTLRLAGKGAPGFVNGQGKVRLSDDEDGGTLVDYDLDAQVGGRIAGVGQRLLDSSARVLTRQALEGLEAQILARMGDGEGGGEAPAPAAPSQGAFAARLARGVAADLVRQPAVIAAVLVVLAVAALVAVRACGG